MEYTRPRQVTFSSRQGDAHAAAKRYLCAADPGYYDTLSKGSKHTLALQGGIMTADEAVSVATHPWWPDALRLRRWDDEAKIVGKVTRPLSAWEPLLRKYFAGGPAAH